MRNHFKVQGTRYKVQGTKHLSPFTFYLSRQRGFTLVEMIVVMVITGIIGGMVAMFIKAPVQGYVDSARRAEMTDIADTALLRLSRDIRTAVPNSVRVLGCGATRCIEFLPTKDGGRYRANPVGGVGTLCPAIADGDALSFDAADTCFEIIGTQITFTAGDQIVIGSTQSDGQPPYVKTFAGNGVLRDVTGLGVQSAVVMAGAQRFPAFAEVQGQRFNVVPGDQQAVTYACENVAPAPAGGDGPGTLRRYWGYGFHATQQTPAGIAANTPPVIAHSNAILADKVSACEIVYDAVNQRNGLVVIRLGITRGGESISLYRQVHVNNVP